MDSSIPDAPAKLARLRRNVIAGRYDEDRCSEQQLAILRRLAFLKWLLATGRIGEF